MTNINTDAAHIAVIMSLTHNILFSMLYLNESKKRKKN
jgi:hypothetical protein